MSSAAANG